MQPFHPPCPFTLPLTVRYHDVSGPLAVDATVTDCRPQTGVVWCRIGTGTLHDADKGPFPLDGLELTLLVAGGRFAPRAVVGRADLSEFQREGLLDAVCSVLNAMSLPGA